MRHPLMLSAVALIAIAGAAVAATTATVTVPPSFDLYQGSALVSPRVTRPSFAECMEAGRLLNKGDGCQSRNGKFRLATVAEPVNCEVSAWDAWQPGTWSACSAGQQSHTETRSRTVTRPAANSGQACPALTETRTVQQACVVEPPPPQSGGDSSITITAKSGESFGAAGPTVVLYDDFRNGSIGSTHFPSAPVGTWAAAAGVIETSSELGGRGLRVNSNAGGQLTSAVTFPATSTVYVSFTALVPNGKRFPGAAGLNQWPTRSAWKGAWVMFDSDGYNQAAKPDYVFPSWIGSYLGNTLSNDAGGPSQFDTGGNAGDVWTWGAPVRYALWIKGNGTSPGDGSLSGMSNTGQFRADYANRKPWFLSSHSTKAFNRVNLVGYLRTGSAGWPTDGLLYSDVYVATGPGASARVEITDAQKYSGSKASSFCTVTKWSATSITCTLRKGRHGSLSGKFLHVFDANDEHVSGGVGRAL